MWINPNFTVVPNICLHGIHFRIFFLNIFFEMADDREVLKEVWDGKIPVCFKLSLDEVVSTEQPTSLYVSNSHKPPSDLKIYERP